MKLFNFFKQRKSYSCDLMNQNLHFTSRDTLEPCCSANIGPAFVSDLSKKNSIKEFVNSKMKFIQMLKKGDIPKRKRANTIIPKIIYVYEGIDYENKKHQLINVKYFGGLYEGTENNQKLWNDVWNYISENYEIDKVKKIYINGDGASWIKTSTDWLTKSKYIADKFHILRDSIFKLDFEEFEANRETIIVQETNKNKYLPVKRAVFKNNPIRVYNRQSPYRGFCLLPFAFVTLTYP